MMRRRGRCGDSWDIIIIGGLGLAAMALLLLIPTVVWLVALGILGGIGLMCLLREC